MHQPKIVCLCGSTRFKEAYAQANRAETLAGNIVVGVGCYSGDPIFETEQGRLIKARLDVLHFAKIDLADEILVLNVDGYYGESTEREIEYARMKGKVIRWMTSTIEQAV